MYSPETGGFIHSPGFTELAQYQGMFEVRASDERIANYSKSGCCIHQADEYMVVDNELVKVFEAIQEEGQQTVRTLVDGEWLTDVVEDDM